MYSDKDKRTGLQETEEFGFPKCAGNSLQRV